MTLTLAFLGCGAVTGAHARRLRRTGADVRLAFASRDRARAAALAAEHGGVAAFGGYEEALAAPAVDAVVVATPPDEHAALARRALEAGKHVVLEKPPATSTADFDALAAAAAAYRRRLLVAENYFYKPLAECLRRLIASGAVGEVVLIQVNSLKRQDAGGWRAGVDALLEGGIHWVDLMANLGLDVESAAGAAGGGSPERTTVATFRYAGGALGVLTHSWEAPSPLRGARMSRIHGRAGSIAFESNGAFVAVTGRRPRVLVPSVRDAGGYRAMWRDLLGVLSRGGEPRFGLDRARRDLALVEQIRSGGPRSG